MKIWPLSFYNFLSELVIFTNDFICVCILEIFLKKILIILIPAILFVSCKTNPPFVPENRVSGKIFLKINFNFVPQSKVVDKVVLVEDFANVSCQPCVGSNLVIKNLTTNVYAPDQLVAIKYHTYFPGPNDPIYLANKPLYDSKISFYNVFFAPTTIVDGLERPDTSALRQKIDSRLTVSPPFEIIVTSAFLEGSYYIDVKINSLASIDLTNIKMEAAIIEKEIGYDAPPGSNGETKFYDVVRNILPSIDGLSLAEVQQSGSSSFEIEDDLLENWKTSELNTVIFIQDKSTKEILQAGSTLH